MARKRWMPAELASSVVAPLVNDYAKVVECFDDSLHISANLWPCGYGNLVRFFDSNDAPIGPGVLGDGVECGGQVGDAHVQIAAASADGPQHPAYAKVAGVTVGDDHVQRCHFALHGEVGILPEIEALHGHVTGLRRGRNQLHLLTRYVILLLSFGRKGILFGDVGDSWPGTPSEG